MSEKRQQLINHLIGSFWEMQSNVRAARGWAGPPRHRAISRHQIELLFVVQQYHEPSVKQIADALDITSGAVSQLVENLVEAGFLERRIVKADRRIVKVALTRKGQHIFHHFHAHRMAKVTDFVSALDDQELTQFVGLLDKIVKNFEMKQHNDKKKMEDKWFKKPNNE